MRVVIAEPTPPQIATVRRHPSGIFIGLYNVTPKVRTHRLEQLHHLGVTRPYDALSGHRVTVGADGVLRLPGYAAWWVVEAPG